MLKVVEQYKSDDPDDPDEPDDPSSRNNNNQLKYSLI